MADFRPYVVRQGDHLLGLAHRMGFDAETVWNDARNADLRARRADMNILLPGDVLQLPPRPAEGVPITLEATNQLVGTAPGVAVHLAIRGADGEPLRSTACWIHGLTGVVEGRTDGSGMLSFEVPVGVREVLLVVDGLRDPRRILVGHLDPVNEPSGVAQRLRSLGYVANHDTSLDADLPPAYVAQRDAEAITDALARFQGKQGLPPTGLPDDATRAALQRAHGS